MEKTGVDINCDLGEGMGNEAAILPLISSCNIACGGHAGDTQSMREVVQLAKKYGVKVGAHPSYPDREHFGRISRSLPKTQLTRSIREQIETLLAIVGEEGMSLHHIKPHGALYNDLVRDADLAQTFLDAVAPYTSISCLYAPYGSIIAKMALDQGIDLKYEAFADRNYRADLSLVPRSEANALLTEQKEVLAHLLPMIKKQEVKTVSGDTVKFLADTYCIHGDTPTALEILMYLSSSLPKHAIYILK